MTPYDQLKTICSNPTPPFKLLIVCPDRIRRERAVDFTLKGICAAAASDSIIKVDGSSLNSDSVAALKESTLNLSLFNAEETYVIKNIDQAGSALSEPIREILSDSKISNNFICSAADISAKSWFSKAFSTKQIVKFDLLQAEDLIKWTVQELKRAGLAGSSPEIARIVTALAEDDCDRIHALIDKLSLYADSDSLQKSDLKNFEVLKEKTEEFHFVNLVALNKKTQAFAYLPKLEANSISAFPLTGLLSKMISNYLGLKIAKSKRLGSAEIQKTLGLSPWALKKQGETANFADEKKLIRTVLALARADSQIKGKNLGEPQVLTELIANI